jgi:hypothetical protein
VRVPVIASRKSDASSELVRVFEDAWQIVRPRHRSIKSRREAQLRLALASTIGQLVASGIRNTRVLRQRAVEEMIRPE